MAPPPGDRAVKVPVNGEPFDRVAVTSIRVTFVTLGSAEKLNTSTVSVPDEQATEQATMDKRTARRELMGAHTSDVCGSAASSMLSSLGRRRRIASSSSLPK